jgi:hypothetical protein
VSSADCRVSVAIPVGAWHPLFPATLRSLALQADNLQLALLDSSNDIRVRSAADDSGLKFVYRRHTEDDGQSSAINEGWTNTTGEILAWLNVDDVLLPNTIDTVVQAFSRDPDLDVFYGGSTLVTEGGSTIGLHEQVSTIDETIYRQNTISQPSCFARRKTVEAIGGINTELQYTMDWDLWVRLFSAKAKFIRSDKYLSAVYWGKNTKTASIPVRRLMEIWRITQPSCGLYSSLKTQFGVIVHYLAWVLRGIQLSPTRADSSGDMVPLPIVNLNDRAASKMTIETSPEIGNDCVIRLNSSSVVLERGQINLDAPLPSGHSIMLHIEADHLFRLRSASLS